MNRRGTLPTLILEALEHEPKHGYLIAKRNQRASRGVRDFKEGKLYPALHKLENVGLVESDETIETGRTRRYYRSRMRAVRCSPNRADSRAPSA